MLFRIIKYGFDNNKPTTPALHATTIYTIDIKETPSSPA